MRNLALADLTPADLGAMLAESETLFVERKSGLAFAAAKAITSFANTLGGWLLVGVRDDGTFTDGDEDGWDPVEPSQMVDEVRQCLETYRVDPMPAFAATVVEYGGSRIGVVRVYESDDAPHVVGAGGHVLVRGVAEDRHHYTAAGVDSQVVLIEMVQRGREGYTRAFELARDRQPSPVLRLGGLVASTAARCSPVAGAALVVAPITGRRLAEWAVSPSCRDAIGEAIGEWATHGNPQPVEHKVDQTALGARQRTDFAHSPDAVVRHPVMHIGVGCDGRVVVTVGYGRTEPRPEEWRLSEAGFRNLLISPLLRAASRILMDAEMYGRAPLTLELRDLAHNFVLDVDGEHRDPPDALLEGEISLPLDEGDEALHHLEARLYADYGRVMGLERFRP